MRGKKYNPTINPYRSLEGRDAQTIISQAHALDEEWFVDCASLEAVGFNPFTAKRLHKSLHRNTIGGKL